jgi:pantoate kinase
MSLRSKILTLDDAGRGQHSKYPPKAFTEKGLYMLATILKSPKATETTIAIVEAFAKMRELSRAISQLSEEQDEGRQKALMRRSGEILMDIIDEDALEITGDETSIELDLAFVKLKRTVKREKRKKE